MAQGSPPRNPIIVHAPRGHGKTALLCAEGLGRVAAQHGVPYLLVPGGSLRSDLQRALAEVAPLQEKERENSASGHGGITSASVTTRMGEATGLHPPPGTESLSGILKDLMAAKVQRASPPRSKWKQLFAHLTKTWRTPEPLPLNRSGSLLLVVDEAHVTNLKDLQTLLNAAQNLRTQGLLVVLAGTPALKSRLDQADATFWDKAERFSPGLLSDQETAQALRDPLAAHGITVDTCVMQRMIRESRRYPFFVQYLGRAVWDALPTGGKHIDADVLVQALPAYHKRQRTLYADRAREIATAGLLRPAVALGKRMQSRPAKEAPLEETVMQVYMTQALVESLCHDIHTWRTLARGPALQSDKEARSEMLKALPLNLNRRAGHTLPTVESLASTAAGAALHYLAAQGFVWEPENLGYQLGIPSLHTYLAAQVEAQAQAAGTQTALEGSSQPASPATEPEGSISSSSTAMKNVSTQPEPPEAEPDPNAPPITHRDAVQSPEGT